jgi:hypothetical protein
MFALPALFRQGRVELLVEPPWPPGPCQVLVVFPGPVEAEEDAFALEEEPWLGPGLPPLESKTGAEVIPIMQLKSREKDTDEN